MALRTYALGKGKWVFIDWMGVEPGYGTKWGGDAGEGYCMPEGIALQVHPPQVQPEPVLVAEHPWESMGISWANFIQEGGRFRCWYDTIIPNDHPKWKISIRSAYAESDDGVVWRKTPLRRREFNGSLENNLLIVDGPFPNLSGHIFIDPQAPAEARYKLVGAGGKHGVLGAVSPDGLAWKGLPEPILPGNNSDTDNCCEFLPELGKYVLYTRQRDGSKQRRGINRAESEDFAHFPPSIPVVEANPCDPPDWDYYSNAFMRWPGAEDAWLMCMGMYRHAPDTVEAHLATSRDTWLWHRPLGRNPWVAPPQNAAYPQMYACHGILPTAPGEWSYYFMAYTVGHNQAETYTPERSRIVRATLREDGFMSLSAEGHGQFWTIPFKCESDRLRLNLRTRFSGYVKCEIIETPIVGGTGHSVSIGEPAPGFTLADCDPFAGDSCDTVLTWKGSADLSRFKGKEIRLRFSLFKADLYALKF